MSWGWCPNMASSTSFPIRLVPSYFPTSGHWSFTGYREDTQIHRAVLPARRGRVPSVLRGIVPDPEGRKRFNVFTRGPLWAPDLLHGFERGGQRVPQDHPLQHMDLAAEWFESDQMKIALGRFASEVMIGPREKGPAPTCSASRTSTAGCSGSGGGSGVLSDKLAQFIKDNGGTIMVSSRSRQSRLRRVRPRGSSWSPARRSSQEGGGLKPQRQAALPADAATLGTSTQLPEEGPEYQLSTFSALNQAVALNEPPKYKAGGTWTSASSSRSHRGRGFSADLRGVCLRYPQ